VALPKLVLRMLHACCSMSDMVAMGADSSIIDGDEEGSKGLPISIKSSIFILMFIPFE